MMPLGPQKYFRQPTNTVIKTNTITHFYLLATKAAFLCRSNDKSYFRIFSFFPCIGQEPLNSFPQSILFFIGSHRTGKLMPSNKTLAIFDSSFFLEACHSAQIFIFLLQNPVQNLEPEPLPVPFATSQMHRNAHRIAIFFPFPYVFLTPVHCSSQEK